jgi:hypothetical protein
MDGHIVILNLEAVNIVVGDTLIIKKQDTFFKTIIESLQVNGEDVQSCSDGEVGVKINKGIKKNSDIFIKQV